LVAIVTSENAMHPASSPLTIVEAAKANLRDAVDQARRTMTFKVNTPASQPDRRDFNAHSVSHHHKALWIGQGSLFSIGSFTPRRATWAPLAPNHRFSRGPHVPFRTAKSQALRRRVITGAGAQSTPLFGQRHHPLNTQFGCCIETTRAPSAVPHRAGGCGPTMSVLALESKLLTVAPAFLRKTPSATKGCSLAHLFNRNLGLPCALATPNAFLQTARCGLPGVSCATTELVLVIGAFIVAREALSTQALHQLREFT
jgi:hypothetical protein